jgi:DNA polymerase-3 subunit epsilon
VRQIVLDTETTGISHRLGDRIIEIGCIELQSGQRTGGQFHCYLDPQRRIHPAAQAVHGISSSFLRGKPLFSDIAAELLEYLDGAELIIHNATFDVGFLNAEFARSGHGDGLIHQRCRVFDTLRAARSRHPRLPNTLDALCDRYGIDRSSRTLHGALLDAEILAEVYWALTG